MVPEPAELSLPLDPLVRHLLASRPASAGRLAAIGDAVLAVDPVDLPGVLLIETRAGRLRARLAPALPARGVDAVVRAPVRLLVDLVEGRVDGDAAFFGRELRVEGRSDIVVAFRNALEDAEIVLARDLPALLGPLAPLACALCGAGGALAAVFADRLRDLERDLLAPAAGAAAAISHLLRAVAGRQGEA